MDVGTFKELIWQKSRELYREMPWREDTRPYYVLVSELMLQQTQVDRVIPKFEAFIEKFPDEQALASASLSEVLILWNGLGYNRRAKYVHEAAKKIVTDFKGIFPSSMEELLSLPGVGPGTAGAISAYAFNKPVIYIETNIRTVYFHHFFEDGNKVHDSQLIPLIEQTLDADHPREFYWALMDYGSWLKRNGVGKITQSQHYIKQSALKGSVREVRGYIVRALSEKEMTDAELRTAIPQDERYDLAIAGLKKDGLIVWSGNMFHLTK